MNFQISVTFARVIHSKADRKLCYSCRGDETNVKCSVTSEPQHTDLGISIHHKLSWGNPDKGLSPAVSIQEI